MNGIISNMNHILEDLYENHLYHYITAKEISKDTWDMFSENIQTHKYWLNENYKDEISLSAAYNDWLEYTLDPFIQAVDRTHILEYIDMNFVMLYKVMMTDWHSAKSASHDTNTIYIHHIVNDFCIKSGRYPKWRKLLLKLGI